MADDPGAPHNMDLLLELVNVDLTISLPLDPVLQKEGGAPITMQRVQAHEEHDLKAELGMPRDGPAVTVSVNQWC